ncbi:PepSY-associated TM helix domain-containing protein [Corticicoccus populi]|uniref:PepSY-associated TM helix domain-containing protein n=1 Tax=Corticicoccus populi TaxID=1812821 RepID=A0ABW5WXT5_9STAP
MKKKSIHPLIWRWHLYAGLIISPFLIILAVTGAIYLFKHDIEAYIYKDYYQVEEGGERLNPSDLVNTAVNTAGGGDVTRYRPGEDPSRSVEVGLIDNNGDALTIFINPYTREVLGTINDNTRPMDIIERVHGELSAGTIGDRIVELIACWTIIMILSGLYLWFPKTKEKIKGVFTFRLNKGNRVRWRDLHAVSGFWFSLSLLFFLLSGLLWTGFWGNGVQQLVTASGSGYPPSIWVGDAPESDIVTEDVADVSWAAEQLPVADSEMISGYRQASINDIAETAESTGIHPSYDIFYPAGETGVFTLSTFPDRAQDEATVHIDQYSNSVIADYRYDHYGPIGKFFALGITIHKGLQFGLINQLFGLVICIGLIGMVATGFWMWWKRKPKGRMGAPKSESIVRHKGILFTLIVLGLIFPLVGVSLIIIWLINIFIIRKNETLRNFFYR